jgi:two-component system, OmpR family, response regulator VicR
MTAEIGRILLISQPNNLDTSLVQEIEQEGYAVTVVSSIAEARSDLSSQGLPAGMIVDLQGLEDDGMEFCQEMVTYAGLAVILIGSSQTEDIPAAALEYADTYLRRNELSAQEIAVRLRQIFSRFGSFAYSLGREVQLTQDLVVDFIAKTVKVGRKEISLTPTEIALLHVMMVHRGSMVASETIINRVWRMLGEGNENSLRVHMHRLRHKLGDSKRSGGVVETVRSVGYSLNQ